MKVEGGGGSGRDYVILPCCHGGRALITEGREGVKKFKKMLTLYVNDPLRLIILNKRAYLYSDIWGKFGLDILNEVMQLFHT